jgi:hypothetical protein
VLPKYPHVTKHTHYKTSQNNHNTRYTPSEIVALRSSSLGIMSRGTSVPSNFTVAFFILVHFETKSLHINHVISLHITSLHVVSLIYTQSLFEFHFLVTTFLTFFLKVFRLQGKGACKPAGNWFQLLMVLFTKECLTTSVLCS